MVLEALRAHPVNDDVVVRVVNILARIVLENSWKLLHCNFIIRLASVILFTHSRFYGSLRNIFLSVY